MNAIKFVTKEIAILLKDKGFKDPCLACYSTDTDEIQYYWAEEGTIQDCLGTCNEKDTEFYDAPSIEHTLRWIRRCHNLYLSIDFDCEGVWYYKVSPMYTKAYKRESYGYYSYEDAALNGIKYILKFTI